MKKITSILLLLFVINQVSAQEKREVERDVKKGDVPAVAVDWMNDTYERAKKVKWYYQEDGLDISFEAKLKYIGRRHSIEFDTTGQVVDIEIGMDWEEVPEDARVGIKEYFEGAYQKWKVLKIQQQWTGAPDDLEDLIDEGEEEDLTIRYEIEYRGQTEEEDELWEGLFEESGELVEKRKIILDNLNNLTY